MVIQLGANVLMRSTWIGALLCLVLRFTDRFLTVVRARLYRQQDKFVVEGSYEINPRSQKDVDALRIVSPGFIRLLLLPPATVLAVRFYAGSQASLLILYLFVLGFFLLAQLAIHLQHVNSLYSFKAAVPYWRGHIEYPRQVAVRGSAVWFVTFALLFVVVFVVTGSLFVLGGALGCATMAALHFRLSLRLSGGKATAG